MKVVLIDDEPLARTLLKNYLTAYDDIAILGEFENGFEGLKGINELNPDLVFLDIHMPKLNGFEMLELLDEIPHVVFTTAYDQYAVKAFENNAIDYLLKPFSKERLALALEKSRFALQNTASAHKIRNFVSDQQEQSETINRVAVKIGAKIKIIYTDDMQYMESQDDYVMIYTLDGKYLKQKTMKYFENHLPVESFVRVHRSYIVRIDFVEQIELYEKDSYVIKLKNGQSIPVSKSGYNRLRHALNF